MKAPGAPGLRSSRLFVGVSGLRLRDAGRLLLVVLALHGPSWFVAWATRSPRAEERPLLNLDLLLAAALACVSTVAGAIVLMLAWAADFIRVASKNYHFMSALDFVDAARFLDMLNMGRFVSPLLVGMVAALALCAWVVLGQVRRARGLSIPLLACCVLAAGLDLANGSFHLFRVNKDRRIAMNFAGSPAWNVWYSQRPSSLAARPPQPMPDAVSFRALGEWQQAHPGASSIVVLVESLGLPRDPALWRWLQRRLTDTNIGSRWTVTVADERFLGATTSGELRVLCGLQGHYSRLDDRLAQGCLPRRLAAAGVTSIGLHGFGLRMFDRNAWWPLIGLQPWVWEGAGRAALPMNCNDAFPGICDRAVLARAVQEARERPVRPR